MYYKFPYTVVVFLVYGKNKWTNEWITYITYFQWYREKFGLKGTDYLSLISHQQLSFFPLT